MKNRLLILLCLVVFSLSSYAQPGYGTELTGNLIIPLGKYAEDYRPSFGALVGFYYDVADNFRMAFVTGYLTSSINESKVNGNFTSGGEQGNINVSGGVSSIPALLSLRLISPGPGMRLYGLIELGLYTYRTHITGTYTLAGVSTPVDESEYRFEGGFVAGGGVLFPLNEELSIDANLRYHWINDSEYSDVPTTDGTYLGSSKLFTLGVGVNWFFPLRKP